MADNIQLNSGSGGKIIRSDDDGTAQWQYVKLAFGADNTQTIVTSTTTNPLPVALSDTDNTVLDNIDSDLTTVAGAVSGNEMQVDIVSGNVTNAGTFAVQEDGAALTALQLIDNIVVVEDAVHGTGDSGVMPLAVRNDTLAALAGTDGDYAPLQVNASGALYIQEGAALDVSGATVTVTDDGSFTLAANSGVDIGDVDVTSVTPGTAAGNLGKAEDAAHSTTDTGVYVLAVRDDVLGAHSGTDGDYESLHVNASGALYVQEGSALDVSAATVTVDLGSNNDVTIDNSSIVKAEDAVHSGGDAGVMALSVRNDTLAALAGADGDYAPLQVNASGALYIQEGAALDVSGATVTTTPSVTGGGTEAAAQRVTLANDSTGVLSVDDNGGALTVDNGGTFAVQVDAALPAGTNAIGKLAANSGVDIGDVDVTSVAAGSNLIGDVGVGVRTSGGTSTHYTGDLDETAVAVKASAGNIYGIHVFNTTAAPLFLQLFNVAQGSVTVGTTTPTNQYVVPGNADSDGAGVVIPLLAPKSYDTAITVACTTDSEGSSAPSTGACIFNMEYA